MYSFVSGIIEEKYDGLVVINNNGIGYEIFMSEYSIGKLPSIGEFTTIQTYLLVREDAFLLYGFADKYEKSIFLKLISVSGVGPKSALQILSGLDADQLVTAIASEDVKAVASIKGVGKKTAERIIVELKNQFDDIQIVANANKTGTTDNMDMATDLLIAMGINKSIAISLIKNCAEPNDTCEEIVQKALRNYNR